ncbi:hypothetical protein HYV73_00510 [Candidatus Uhrbacteria bacterium]|nr:hypothetical protein [Candidatus Uhrbacteria bacterium]
MTPKALTPGQQTQFNRFVEDGARKALNEVVLDNEGLQMLLENGGEFHEDIVASIHRLSRTNQYASEENPCQIGYSSGYRMKPISEQVAILRGYFPNLGGADERVIGGQLPGIMEGWFAIPRWQKIGDSYSEAFEKLLSVIGSTRKFHNYREGQLGPDRLRQLGRSMKIFQEVCEEQKGMDIIIVPAQFGAGVRAAGRARSVSVGSSVSEASARAVCSSPTPSVSRLT